jgi:hypothetical protein
MLLLWRLKLPETIALEATHATETVEIIMRTTITEGDGSCLRTYIEVKN